MSSRDAQRYRKVYSYYRPVPRQAELAPGSVDKDYVDNMFAALDWKQSVRCASVANVSLVSPGAVDGVTLQDEDRVLLKEQTDPKDNGIYVYYADIDTLVRTLDATQDSLTSGAACYSEKGLTNEESAWILTTQDPITVGTTSQTWVRFGGSSIFTLSAFEANTIYSASFGGPTYVGDVGADVFFYVSGTIGGKDSVTGSVAVFGGDTVTSGNINLFGEIDFISGDSALEISASSVTFDGNWIESDSDLYFSANGQMFSLAANGEQAEFETAYPDKTIIGALLDLTGALAVRMTGHMHAPTLGVSGSVLDFGVGLGFQMSSASAATVDGRINKLDLYVNGLRMIYYEDFEVLSMHTFSPCFSYSTSTKFQFVIYDSIPYP